MTKVIQTASDFIEYFRHAGESLPGILDANAMVKWLPPNGFTGQVHHLDAKVGALTRCRSPISQPARATRSWRSILS